MRESSAFIINKQTYIVQQPKSKTPFLSYEFIGLYSDSKIPVCTDPTEKPCKDFAKIFFVRYVLAP